MKLTKHLTPLEVETDVSETKFPHMLSLTDSERLLCEAMLTDAEMLRVVASHKLERHHKEELGQFLTPLPVAELMVRMFQKLDLPHIHLLDAGAGTGSLSAAFVANVCRQQRRPDLLEIKAYEIDPILSEYLRKTLQMCERECKANGIRFRYEIYETDFIKESVRLLCPDFFNHNSQAGFTHSVLNPPYFKINAHSAMRMSLRAIGVEASNIYPGFMAAAAQLLTNGGEFVAIAPRSFCNGSYFKNFRKMFLDMMALQQVHLFESRQKAFRDDHVLQETVIIHALKQKEKSSTVAINTTMGTEDDLITFNTLPYQEVVRPDDSEQFIRIVPDALSEKVIEQMANFTCSLDDLGLKVSTGRVVDFRAKEYLKLHADNRTVPLIYPVNFTDGYVEHPKITRKPQALIHVDETAVLLVPNGHYVLTKRFSSKEEKKRVVAAVYDAARFDVDWVGFENHLNYFHQNGNGLNITLAKGLAAYLNCNLVDSFFRLFNGHTQVNATDLRNLKYPNLEQLLFLGEQFGESFPSQQQLDKIVEERLLSMTDQGNESLTAIKMRIDEALEILKQLGFPRAQLNERSALTLLALLNLKSSEPWHSSSSPLMGITPMMDFMAEHYGKTYKPNTRETVRRRSIHQFLDAALIVANPDDAERPINSPKTVYRIEESALELLRTYGTQEWDKSIRTYLASVQTLQERYAQERVMSRIPVVIEGEIKTLSPGGQNVLIEKIIKEFAPRFTPGGKLLYVGDTDEKFAHFNHKELTNLGVSVDSHGKMPDVIIYFTQNSWLVLIEAVTSHGPIDPKRKSELETLFRGSHVPLVMVTTFLSRKAMVEYLADIAWETDVWVAEDPSHLIHFNGQLLLQLYQLPV